MKEQHQNRSFRPFPLPQSMVRERHRELVPKDASALVVVESVGVEPDRGVGWFLL